MSVLRDDPPLIVIETPVQRPSRLRVIIAVLLLTAIGLLAAASGFASRPYQPAQRPTPVFPLPSDPSDHC